MFLFIKNKKSSGENTIPYILCFSSYLILIFFLFFNNEIIPPAVKLISVVGLSSILLLSFNCLEYGPLKCLTANKWIGLLGASSYSIYVWHQVIIAFTRYSFTNEFGINVFIMMLLVISLVSVISYIFIEKKLSLLMKTKKIRLTMSCLFIWLLTIFVSGGIYLKAGIVRDVPELDTYVDDAKRGIHAEYNRQRHALRVKQFETDKPHWLILGNSFANDWANVVLESDIKDKVELLISSPDSAFLRSEQIKYKSADRIFVSMLNVDEDIINKVLSVCVLNGLSKEQLFIVGEKDFGQNSGQIYWHKGDPNYFKMTARMDDGFYEKNERLKSIYKIQFVDLIGLVLQDDGTVRVFTDDCKFISQDTQHFTKGGAKYFAKLIDWSRFFEK